MCLVADYTEGQSGGFLSPLVDSEFEWGTSDANQKISRLFIFRGWSLCDGGFFPRESYSGHSLEAYLKGGGQPPRFSPKD